MLYFTILYSTVLDSTILYCTVLYCAVLYSTVLYSILLYSGVVVSIQVHKFLYRFGRVVWNGRTDGQLISPITALRAVALSCSECKWRNNYFFKVITYCTAKEVPGQRSSVDRQSHIFLCADGAHHCVVLVFTINWFWDIELHYGMNILGLAY